jgi:hypothetical protein
MSTQIPRSRQNSKRRISNEFLGSVIARAARRYIFRPPILVNSGDGTIWYTLWSFALFYGNCLYFWVDAPAPLATQELAPKMAPALR